ncbi:MAG TPA: NB-ARC domain-containing protein, partial [Ktedonobacterales bacterium]
MRAVFTEDAVWYDHAPMRGMDYRGGLAPGDPFAAEIVHQLAARNVLLVVLSPEAVASGWVAYEIEQGIVRYLSAAREYAIILPIMRTKVELPDLLRIFHFADMTGEDTYATALAEVIAQIRSGESRRVEREGQPPFDLTELPVPASFIGRTDDLEWVLDRLRAGQTSAVTAIRGIGGIGKSTLAGEAVRALYAEDRFPEGIAVIGCAEQSDPTVVLARVLTRFDARRAAPQVSTLPELAALAAQLLRNKRALVVLDNVEPEWPITDVVTPLRQAGAVVLLTARQQLPRAAVAAEGSRELDLLSAAQALDLFARAAGRSAAELPPAERGAAAEIVALLDRHTLALQLAGVYAAGRDLNAVAREMKDPSRVLGLPDELDVPDAMRRVFATSYRTLDADARRLFAALAAFATNEFGRQAALALGTGLGLAQPATSLDLLVRRALASASVDETLPETADRERLRLHALLRAFAEGLFATEAAARAGAALATVAAYYADYANATPDLALTPDEANISGALEWAHERGEDDPDAEAIVMRICDGMRGFWRDTGRTRAGLRYLTWGSQAGERVAARTGEQTDRLRAANIALYYGDILMNVGRLPQAEL